MSIYKRGKFYWLNVVDQSGRQIRQSAETVDRKVALKLEAQLRVTLGTAAEVFDIDSASVTSITFAQLMDEFLIYQAATKKRSLSSFFTVYVKELKAWFADIPLSGLNVKLVERYRAERLASTSPATTNRSIAVLRRAMNLAIRWGYIEKNPATHLDRIKEPSKIFRVLGQTEQQAYLGACSSDEYRFFSWLALRTGMRRGELQDLRARDIDPGRSMLSLPMTKGGTSRHIPILPKVYRELQELAATRKPSDFLLQDERGKPWSHTVLRRRHANALRDARLPAFRFHDLRHTYASDLLASGAQMHVVQHQLGHASIKTTEIYAHLNQDQAHQALAVYGRFLGSDNTFTAHDQLDLRLDEDKN